MTLFFENEEDCVNARDALGQTRRRPTDVDKSHGGRYSKLTGHYGMAWRDRRIYRVPIRFKLIIDGTALEGLSFEQRQALKFVDGGDVQDWIAQ